MFSPWSQKPNTLLYHGVKCGIYGYEPQIWPHRKPKDVECEPQPPPGVKCDIYGYEPQIWPHRKPKDSVCRANDELSMADFKEKRGFELPEWWPINEKPDNGIMITHLYRFEATSSEALDHSAISHNGYQSTVPLPSLVDAIEQQRGCFISTSHSLPGRYKARFGHRKVSLEDIRHRLQIVHELWFLDRTRICWILWFNEARAMSSVFCDQTYVSYDQKPFYFYSTASGYKPQVQQFDKVPHRVSAREQPRRINFGLIGSPIDSAAEDTCTYVPASVIYKRLDLFVHASHIDASIAEHIKMRGYLPVIHGGSMTSLHQIADTDLHRNFRKEYKKRMSCRTTVNATDS